MTDSLLSISNVISHLPRERLPMLPPPEYQSLPSHQGTSERPKVGLAVESMKHHMTSEGWELFQSLEYHGWKLAGHNLPINTVEVPNILERWNPYIVFVQDKREYEGLTADRSQDPLMRFRNIEVLKERPDIFKLTVIKDCQNSPKYHSQSASEMGCHAWVCYYHPRIVSHLCSYVRPQHLIRTYHTIDSKLVPPYTSVGRQKGILSGAVSGAYPLRAMLVRKKAQMPSVDVLPHPGYGRKGCYTPRYLWTLSRYKVSICTASIYGYALRKIMESVACGCIVITDLPTDEVLPEINESLVRVSPSITARQMQQLVEKLCSEYDPEKQKHYAEKATTYYDFKEMGLRLSAAIEEMRRNYNN